MTVFVKLFSIERDYNRMGFIHSFVIIIGLGRLSNIFAYTYVLYNLWGTRTIWYFICVFSLYVLLYTIYPHSLIDYLIFKKPPLCWYYARINFPLRLNEQFSFIISFSLDRRGAAIRATRSKTDLNLSDEDKTTEENRERRGHCEDTGTQISERVERNATC